MLQPISGCRRDSAADKVAGQGLLGVSGEGARSARPVVKWCRSSSVPHSPDGRISLIVLSCEPRLGAASRSLSALVITLDSIDRLDVDLTALCRLLSHTYMSCRVKLETG
jgi:hypothetical protein